MNKLARYLNEHIHGVALSSASVIEAYATDNSVLKVKPQVVVLPANTNDVRKVVRFSDQLAERKFKVPVTVRGSGTSKTGACLGNGIVVSMERMNKVSEVDERQRLVRCQAGATLEQLNAALGLYGLTVPVAANPRRTIGGLIADAGRDAAGLPTIQRYLEKAEIVLATGDCIQTETLARKALRLRKKQRNAEGIIYRDLGDLLVDKDKVVNKWLNKNETMPAGYEGLSRVTCGKDTMNIMPLLFSSEGTLAVITEVILRCEYLGEPPVYFWAEFPDGKSAMKFAAEAAVLGVGALDLYDLQLIKEVKDSGKKLRPFTKKTLEEGFLVVARLDDTRKYKRRSKLRNLAKLMGSSKMSVDSTTGKYDDFTEIQSILLAYLNDTARSERLPLLDGAYVPEKKFDEYLERLKALSTKHGVKMPVFGSYVTSCYSVRPEINLSSVTGRQLVMGLLKDYYKLLDSVGGRIAGEAGEGRIKGIVTTPEMDPKLMRAYTKVKHIFDSRGILNPGVKTDANLRAVIRQLRTSYNDGVTEP